MNLQCRTCWTVFDASLAERVNTDFSNRVLVCPPCADTFNQVIPREEWTPAEVEEVTPEAPAPAGLPYTFHLKIDGCIEEIDVPARTETEAWEKAREVQADLYGGAGELRLWV